MPAPVLSDWLNNIDPQLEAQYPNVGGSQKGAILEIRRERRVELACEGFRLDDLKRWKAGSLAAMAPRGMYIDKLGAVDITGDDVPEFYVSQTGEGFDDIKAQYPGVEIFEYRLTGATFQFTGGDKGYLQLNGQIGAFQFPDKYYFSPISDYDITINSNLVQNPLWK